MTQPRVLIVDPVCSASYLCATLRHAGIHTTALYVTSSDSLHLYPPSEPAHFDHQKHMEGASVKEVERYVARQEFDLILNGSRRSTSLTDSLSSRFTPGFCNSPATSRQREDACEMQDALGRAGLATIRQLRVKADPSRSSLGPVLAELHLPVCCKPDAGDAIIGASPVFTEDELSDVLGSAFAAGVSDCLVQQLVRGTEYAIDTFSVGCQHFICGILRYEKIPVGQSPVYRSVMVERDPGVCARCSAYAQMLLQTLDMQFGFGHIEIVIGEHGTIRLMEFDTRISGAEGTLNRLCKLAGLDSQVDALVQQTLHGGVRIIPCTAASCAARALFLFRLTDGMLRDPRPALSQLSTVQHVMLTLPPDSYVVRRARPDFRNLACVVLMQGRTESQLDHDAEIVFRLEESGDLL